MGLHPQTGYILDDANIKLFCCLMQVKSSRVQPKPAAINCHPCLNCAAPLAEISILCGFKNPVLINVQTN